MSNLPMQHEVSAQSPIRTEAHAARFQRLFRRQMALVLAVVVGLTVVHFLLAAGGLNWLETNMIFLGGLAIAAAVLIWSIHFVSREAEDSFEALQDSYLSSVRALSGALEARDHYTNDHSESVTGMVLEVGRKLGMGEPELSALRYAALFHDIGKIGIPDRILNKPGPLTREEWIMMERHTLIGEQILAPLDFMCPALPIVRHEHERWDGMGYPDGLAGETIPLGARIILVCDAFHAITSDRPYRDALGPEEAADRLRAGARHAVRSRGRRRLPLCSRRCSLRGCQGRGDSHTGFAGSGRGFGALSRAATISEGYPREVRWDFRTTKPLSSRSGRGSRGRSPATTPERDRTGRKTRSRTRANACERGGATVTTTRRPPGRITRAASARTSSRSDRSSRCRR